MKNARKNYDYNTLKRLQQGWNNTKEIYDRGIGHSEAKGNWTQSKKLVGTEIAYQKTAWNIGGFPDGKFLEIQNVKPMNTEQSNLWEYWEGIFLRNREKNQWKRSRRTKKDLSGENVRK